MLSLMVTRAAFGAGAAYTVYYFLSPLVQRAVDGLHAVSAALAVVH